MRLLVRGLVGLAVMTSLCKFLAFLDDVWPVVGLSNSICQEASILVSKLFMIHLHDVGANPAHTSDLALRYIECAEVGHRVSIVESVVVELQVRGQVISVNCGVNVEAQLLE